MKYCALVCICLFSLMCLLSCGLEEFYYIDYVPPGDYNDTNTVINLPSSGADGYSNYFDNFIIFYRIYISSTEVQTVNLDINADARSTINSTLNSDYIGLYPFTDITSTSVNTSNLESTFFNRRYFLLSLQDADITRILGSGSLGRTLNIAFPPNPGVHPTLTINGISYRLQRAEEAPTGQSLVYNPQPNRDLLNRPALYSNENVNNGNTDVVSGSGTPRYTYVSMYIAAKGRSTEALPRSIYSQPTFIGIFRLAG